MFLELLSPENNRELGAIETLQNLTLILILFLGTLSAVKKTFPQAIIHWLFLFFALFVFLEEVDYFMNYSEVLRGKSPYSYNLNGFRNMHNISSLVWLRKTGYQVLVYLTLIFIFLRLKKEEGPGLVIKAILFCFIVLQFVLNITYQLISPPENARQIISETLELNLYTSWLFLLTNHIQLIRQNR